MLLLLPALPGSSQIIATVAGDGQPGVTHAPVAATTAHIGTPAGVAVDKYGNFYIAEYAYDQITKVTPDGVLTVVAGTSTSGYSGDGGPATDAQLSAPYSVAVDTAGNVFFSDYGNSVVREISASGIIRTVAGTWRGYGGDGGPATDAQLNFPYGVATDPAGNLYIVDDFNFRVRKVSPDGIINTIAGTGEQGYTGDGGPATAAQLSLPIGIALDTGGNIYFTESGNYDIRKISPTGIITTVAGSQMAGFSGDGGAATQARMTNPWGIATDNRGNLYFTDMDNNRIRMIDPAGIIHTLVGNGSNGFSGDGGPPLAAALNAPYGVAIGKNYAIYIADWSNERIRVVDTCREPRASRITGGRYVCLDSVAELYDSTAGGKWSSSDTLVVRIDSLSGKMVVAAEGSAVITYTIPSTLAYCSSFATFPVRATTIKIAGHLLPVSCYGLQNGSISVHVTGGTGYYQYLWSDGSADSSIANLGPGEYIVSVQDDSSHCSLADTFSIAQPDSLLVNSTVTNDACHTGRGSIAVAVSGGTPPYSYVWSNHANGAENTALLAGSYDLTLKDLNGCAKEMTYAVADSNCKPVIVHDGMSPNGDGINDAWIVENIQDYPMNQVQVYDKWGDQVFAQTNYSNDWSGTGKNGLLPDGTYYYIVKLNSSQVPAGSDTYTGSLLIKR